jgi:hypothetical protein
MLYRNDNCFTYHYDSEGRRVESPEPEADAPMILFKDGLAATSASETDASTVASSGEAPEDDGSWCGRYVFTGQELDVDPELLHCPVRGVPDLTPGRFLED